MTRGNRFEVAAIALVVLAVLLTYWLHVEPEPEPLAPPVMLPELAPTRPGATLDWCQCDEPACLRIVCGERTFHLEVRI